MAGLRCTSNTKQHVLKKKMLTFAAYDSMRSGTIVCMKYAAIEVGSVSDEPLSFSQ